VKGMAFDLVGIKGTILTVVLIVGIALMIISVIIFFVFKTLQKIRFGQYSIVIWGKDSFGQITESYDTGGIFEDKKTHNKLLFLKKNNVGLDPDNIPVIKCTKKKPVIYLRQTGLKNFHFIKITMPDDYPTLQVGEEDLNWAINAFHKAKATFAQSTLMQYLPYISLALVSVVILILFIYLFKQFDSLKEFMMIAKEIAVELTRARTGIIS